MQQRDLTCTSDHELYNALDVADRLRSREGRSPEAIQVRIWCTRQKACIRRELQRRGLPTARPDERWAGIGRGCRVGRTSSAALQQG